MQVQVEPISDDLHISKSANYLWALTDDSVLGRKMLCTCVNCLYISIQQHLEWLESACDHFLSKQNNVGDTPAVALEKKKQHEKFLESIQVT